jgi:hypothetical protein
MILSATPGVATEYLKELIHSAPGKSILVTVKTENWEDEDNCSSGSSIDLGWIPYEWIVMVSMEGATGVKVIYQDEGKKLKEEYFDRVMFVGDVDDWAKFHHKTITYNF